ncbi:MAG: hypothetical protein ACK41D_02910 [Rubricoccaceae bacterium]
MLPLLCQTLGLLALTVLLAPSSLAAASSGFGPVPPPDTLRLVLVPAERPAEALGYRLPTPPPPGPFSVSSYRGLTVGSASTVGSLAGASLTTAVVMLAVVSFLPCGFAGTCDVPYVSDRTFEAVALAGSLAGSTAAVLIIERSQTDYAGPLRLPRPDVRRGDAGAAFLGVLAGTVPGVFAARAAGRHLSDENKPASFVALSLAQGAGAALAVHLRRQTQERPAVRPAYPSEAP